MFIRQPGFQGGEVAHALSSRTDIAALRLAVAKMLNFIPTPTGAAVNRAGFQFIAETKDSGARPSRLIPFTFSTSQAYLLEFGHLYVRVYQGGVLIATVATPYTDAEVPALEYVQSGDTLTLFHIAHAPQELKRTGPSSWTLGAFSVARTQWSPGIPTFVAPFQLAFSDATHVAREWTWVVTSIGPTNEESLPSFERTATTQLAPDRPVYMTCAPVAGANTYYWYRGRYGVYGFVGSSALPSFVDEGQVPNYSDRPPQARDPFASGEYPSVGAYFQQRLFVGNQPSYPQRVQATQTGRYHNFDTNIPLKSDDAVDFTVASRQYEEIRALVGLRSLVVLTANTEFIVDTNGGALTPTTVNLVPVSYNGCAKLRPIVIDDTVLYVQAQQSAVRELAPGGGADRLGWKGTNLSYVAGHLLSDAGRTIKEWTFQRLPYSTAWAVRDDGQLLSLTYDRELQVVAWAQHATDGVFESICSIPEGSENVVYAIVRRVIGGDTVRYIERMASRFVNDVRLGCFLDSSVFYQGAPASVFGALNHLEGKQVKVLRDGVVDGPYTVSGGQIALATPGSEVFIGLPYNSDIELLDVKEAGDAEVGPLQKLVSRAIWEVDRTAGVTAGETFDSLTPWKAEMGHPTPSTGVLSEQLVVPTESSWNRGGRAVLRQSDPLPVAVLGAVREIEVGA